MVRGIVMLALFGVVTGCTADTGDGGILVLKNVHPTTGCTTTGTEDELSTSHGSLDLGLISPYLFIAQMRSRITALDGQEDQRTIITSGANIDITFPGSTVFNDAELADLKTNSITHFKRLFSAPIAPNGGVTDVGFELIPIELAARIALKAGNSPLFRLETLATFTVTGDASGQSVQSQAFSYPVTIGNNLSIVDHGACPITGTVRSGYACNPVQDGVVDCCEDPQLGLLCPGTAATN